MIRVSSFTRYLPLRPTLRIGAKTINLRRAFSVGAKSATEVQNVPIGQLVVDASNAQLLAMELPTNENSMSLLKTRHTSAHILAMAVQKTFPKVKVTVGPWIDSG